MRAKRRDLMARRAVLERLLQDGAVLPIRFGLVAPAEEDLVAILEENAEKYAENLRELDGCVDYNVKAGREEEDLLREVVAQSEEIHRLNERTRQNPHAHDDKAALGGLVSQAVEQQYEKEAWQIVNQLAPLPYAM